MCRGRAGPEKSASVLQGSRSQGTRWKASCQLVSMLGFCTKCQCFSLICFALHRVGLQHLGRGRDFRSRGLFGCCRFNQIWMLFLFRRCFRTGCQSEARGWGVSLFCARFVLSRLRLLCFEARLSGCCVREGGVKGVNPGFLVLAFSTRTFESSGVPARRVQAGDMLPLVCSNPACPGLFVVVRFRGFHRCCFLGCCFPLKISLWLSCLHCVGLRQQFGGSGRGFLSRGLLAAQVHESGCTSCFTGCWWQ